MKTIVLTELDKENARKLPKTDLIAYYWKVLNSLNQYATDEENYRHCEDVAYLVPLIGYDPIC